MSQPAVWNDNDFVRTRGRGVSRRVHLAGDLFTRRAKPIEHLAPCEVLWQSVSNCSLPKRQNTDLRPYNLCPIAHGKAKCLQVNIIHDLKPVVTFKSLHASPPKGSLA